MNGESRIILSRRQRRRATNKSSKHLPALLGGCFVAFVGLCALGFFGSIGAAAAVYTSLTQNLPDPAQRLLLRQTTARLAAQLLQVLPFDKVHHQVLTLPGDDEMVDHLGQVGMRQVAQDLRFALELALRFGGGLQVFLEGA